MRLLLDTHIAAWSVLGGGRIRQVVRTLMTDPANELWVSDVSFWEIAVKRATGRKSTEGLPASVEDARRVFGEAGFAFLPIAYEHIRAFAQVPVVHGDPFDRLLVAQALTEPMRLVTHDRQVAAYSDTVILA